MLRFASSHVLREQTLLTLTTTEFSNPLIQTLHLPLKNHLSGEAPREQLGINQSAPSCQEEFGLSGD